MSEAAWRQATEADLDAIVAVQDRVHTLTPESRAVFAAKLASFPRGCRVLEAPSGPVGYGVFHPWRLGDVPALHALPFIPPDRPDCLFVHDVALLPAARGRGAARDLLGSVVAAARELGLRRLALVSVYGTAPLWGQLGFSVSPLTLDAAKRAQYGDTARYMTAELPP